MFICYVGVQGWLVKSGVVSLRWFMQNSAPNKEVGRTTRGPARCSSSSGPTAAKACMPAGRRR
jgi:hypothetical protein